MITVSIIGSGNVAFHLISALKKAPEIKLMQVCARDKKNIQHLVDSTQIISNIEDLETVDVCIIAVSDAAISKVSESIKFENKIVAHTSGSIAMKDLYAKNRRAVFYPLQTFSIHKEVDFSKIPICIECEDSDDYEIIEKIARSISKIAYSIDTEQRKAVHVSAVFVNNFVNELYEVGYEICRENNISFDILKPLIKETAEKIQTLTPTEAQTGPAKRKDQQTISTHLDFLKDQKKKDLYTLMTQSIQSHE
jgi:predicted short-subunit dehydrogenase-like oxidoreductase (DUF2520 family)